MNVVNAKNIVKEAMVTVFNFERCWNVSAEIELKDLQAPEDYEALLYDTRASAETSSHWDRTDQWQLINGLMAIWIYTKFPNYPVFADYESTTFFVEEEVQSLGLFAFKGGFGRQIDAGSVKGLVEFSRNEVNAELINAERYFYAQTFCELNDIGTGWMDELVVDTYDASMLESTMAKRAFTQRAFQCFMHL